MKIEPTTVIAILDDNLEDLKFFETILKERPYSVLTISDSDNLLPLLEKEHPDAVIISLELPNETGLALVHHVGALNPDVPIIVTAGPSSTEAVSSARALGAHGSLFKPLAGDDVLVTIDQLLQIAYAQSNQQTLPPSAERADRLSKTAQLRPLSLLKKGQALLACQRIDELCERLMDIVFDEIDAVAASIYLSRPNTPGVLAVEHVRGSISASADVHLESHPHGEQLAGGVPFVVTAASTASPPVQIWIPLGGGKRLIGALLIERDNERSMVAEEEAINLAEIMADISVAAFNNIQRLEFLQQSGIKDPATSAYTFTYFADFAGRQIETSRRHGHRLSIATLAVTNWAALSTAFKSTLLGRLSSRIVEVVLECIRDSDMLARIDDDEYCVLFPETGNLGGLSVRRRLMDTLGADAAIYALEAKAPLGLALGVASFPNDGQDLGRLMRISHERAVYQKHSPLITQDLEESDFWNTFDALLGTQEQYLQPDGASAPKLGDPAEMDDVPRGFTHLMIPESQAQHTTAMLLEEVSLRQAIPGVCYVHAGLLPAIKHLRLTSSATVVYVIKPAGDWAAPPEGVAEIPIDDTKLVDARFMFFLGETQWYGLIGRAIGDDLIWGLHFSDVAVVDDLIYRLQKRYYLQHALSEL